MKITKKRFAKMPEINTISSILPIKLHKMSFQKLKNSEILYLMGIYCLCSAKMGKASRTTVTKHFDRNQSLNE